MLDRVVENYNLFSRVHYRFLGSFQLKNLVIKQTAYSVLENGGHCIDEECRLHSRGSLFLHYCPIIVCPSNVYFIRKAFEAIQRVLHIRAWKSLFDRFEISLVPKRQMIYFETVVQVEALHLHCHSHVVEVLSANVKIAWNSVEFEITLKTTTLSLIEFFLGACSEVLSRHILFSPCLYTYVVALFVKPVLVEFSVVIAYVVIQTISETQPNDVTRDIWEGNVKICMERIG